MLATCNRIEIYAEVDRFHGSVEDLTALLADARRPRRWKTLLRSLYVHYDEGAVAHLFEVATGLDSMVVGREPDPGPGTRGTARRAERLVGRRVAQHALPAGTAGRQARARRDRHRPRRTVRRVRRARGGGRGAGPARRGSGLHRRRRLGRGPHRRIGTSPRVGVHRRLLTHAGSCDRLGSVGRRAVGTVSRPRPTRSPRADLVISCTGATGPVITAEMIATATAVARPVQTARDRRPGPATRRRPAAARGRRRAASSRWRPSRSRCTTAPPAGTWSRSRPSSPKR